MDFLLVTIASILFPYIFNLSGTNYQTYLGVKNSLQNINSYSIEFFDKETDYRIKSYSLITYTGYGIRPELFLDYDINLGRLIIGPSIGFEPLNTGIQFRSVLKTGGSQSTSTIHYNKGPNMGLKIGYSIFQSNSLSEGYGAFGFIPYVVVGVVPVSYEGEAYYQAAHEKRYNIYWGVGAKVDVKGPWSIYGQYKRLTFDTNGSSLNQQLIIKESEFQFGLAYWLRTQERKAKMDKATNYDQIIQALDKDSIAPNDEYQGTVLGAPLGEATIKDGERSPSFNNLEQTRAISDSSKKLKRDSKLLEKAQNKKVNSAYDLNPYNFN